MTTAAAQRIMDIAETLPNEAEQPIINFMINYRVLEKLDETEPVNTEYKAPEPVSLPFDENYTEENREQRMNRFFEARGNIEIDREAVTSLRERSMI